MPNSYLSGNVIYSKYSMCYARRSCAQLTVPAFALSPYCVCTR